MSKTSSSSVTLGKLCDPHATRGASNTTTQNGPQVPAQPTGRLDASSTPKTVKGASINTNGAPKEVPVHLPSSGGAGQGLAELIASMHAAVALFDFQRVRELAAEVQQMQIQGFAPLAGPATLVPGANIKGGPNAGSLSHNETRRYEVRCEATPTSAVGPECPTACASNPPAAAAAATNGEEAAAHGDQANRVLSLDSQRAIVASACRDPQVNKEKTSTHELESRADENSPPEDGKPGIAS